MSEGQTHDEREREIHPLRLEELRINNEREWRKEIREDRQAEREQQALYLKIMAGLVGVGMVVISSIMLFIRFWPQA